MWAAFLMVGNVKPAWRWLQRRRSASWPTAHGRVESAVVSTLRSGRSTVYEAELVYTYAVWGRTYAGLHTEEFAADSEAQEFVWDLKGKPVEVHYNPNEPSRSLVSEPALKVILESRSPFSARPLPVSATKPIPQWLKPFLWVFVLLSAVGLAASLWVHLGAVAGHRAAPEAYFWILHVGIFVVWFPAVLASIRITGNANRKGFWKVVLRGSPAWMRYMVCGFFGYAFVNFFLFMTTAPHKASGGNPPAIVWRGFSGHWMAFYSAALAIFYSAARSGDQDP